VSPGEPRPTFFWSALIDFFPKTGAFINHKPLIGDQYGPVNPIMGG
jgi:hypothetical protein